ncbi:hypothetical protein ACU686_37390 [Yinghuangia aomiensis]
MDRILPPAGRRAGRSARPRRPVLRPARPAGPPARRLHGPARVRAGNGRGGLAGPGQAPYPAAVRLVPAPAAGGSRKNRNLIIGLVALLVVGGLVAVLVFTLGGKDDKSGVATDGTLTDTTTGVTIPFIKGWDKDTDKDRPAHQTKDKVACSDESGSASSDLSDGPSPDSSESDSSSDCYLGEAEVAYVPGKSFDGAVSRMQGQIKNGDDFKVTKTVREDKTKIDGKNAQVLVYEVEENKGSAGAHRDARVHHHRQQVRVRRRRRVARSSSSASTTTRRRRARACSTPCATAFKVGTLQAVRQLVLDAGSAPHRQVSPAFRSPSSGTAHAAPDRLRRVRPRCALRRAARPGRLPRSGDAEDRRPGENAVSGAPGARAAAGISARGKRIDAPQPGGVRVIRRRVRFHPRAAAPACAPPPTGNSPG